MGREVVVVQDEGSGVFLLENLEYLGDFVIAQIHALVIHLALKYRVVLRGVEGKVQILHSRGLGTEFVLGLSSEVRGVSVELSRLQLCLINQGLHEGQLVLRIDTFVCGEKELLLRLFEVLAQVGEALLS